MVFDTLENAAKYAVLNERFAMAIEFLQKKAPFLDLGRYELDGENVYATIVEVDLKNEKDARLEVHDKYIDVQAVLKGSETYGFAVRKDCKKPIGQIDPQKDILFFEDPKQTHFTANAGQFMIFYPSDAHAPLIGHGKVLKAIVKVKI